jgi:hypothetical protein
MKIRVVLLLLLVIFAFSCGALAQEEATGEQAVAPKSFWEVIFDNALSITLAFIFISALIGTILRNLSIDKCLHHFDEFHVTLELVNTDLIWGTLKMYSTGLELLYRKPRLDSSGHYESSFILYASEYDTIQAICRYHGDLSEKRCKIREADIRKTYQPTIFARTIRWVRNLVNTFSDAFSKSLNVIIGQMKKLSPGSVILKQDAQLSKIGTDIIGYAGNAYDPILERYIGEKVVIEVTYADRKEEYLGILKEYTSTFMELLNVSYIYLVNLPFKGQGSGKFEISGIYVKKEDETYLIENQSVTPIQVYDMTKDGVTSPLQLEIGPQDKQVVFEDDPEAIDVSVMIKTRRTVDLIVPRSKALIRHAGPREKIGWKELLGFDDVESFFGRFRREPKKN